MKLTEAEHGALRLAPLLQVAAASFLTHLPSQAEGAVVTVQLVRGPPILMFFFFFSLQYPLPRSPRPTHRAIMSQEGVRSETKQNSPPNDRRPGHEEACGISSLQFFRKANSVLGNQN